MKNLYKYFDELLEKESTCFDNEKQLLENVLENGCQSGVISELTWYSQISFIYNNYETELDDFLENLTENSGLKPWELFSEWDIYPNSPNNCCLIVWSCFENYCDEKLNNIK